LLGAVLGLLDGLGAFAYPGVADQMTGIIIGSTFKGLVTGILAGFFAKKFESLPLGILFGLVVGFAFSWLVAVNQPPDASGRTYFYEIILPGAILGAIVGFATQKFGRGAAKPA
jgi:hypothetical protein